MSAEELIAQGVQLGQAQRYREAVERFMAALELAPDSSDAYFNLGIAHRSLDELELATQAFEKAVKFRASWAEAWFNLANAHRDARRREAAINAYRRALEHRPQYLKALNNLANVLSEQGELSEAERHLQQALSSKPDYVEGLYNLSRVYKRQRKWKQAEDALASALKLQPQAVRFWLKLAELQKTQGRGDDAERSLAAALQLQPHNAEGLLQQAQLRREQNKLEEAITLLLQASLAPNPSSDVFWTLADCYRAQNKTPEALAALDRALALDPHSAAAHNLRGVILLAAGDPEGAIVAYERAIQLRPDQADAYNNLGAALQAVRRYSDGIAAFDSALRLKPNFATAHLNRALSLLRAHRYDEGWREFEWRMLCPDYRMAPVHRPVWNGEQLDGKTILLRYEQGLGDTFQFIRFAPLVKARGGRVAVECQNAVRHLVATCPGVDQAVVRGEPLPHVDVQVPLMSLPGIFGTTPDTVPTPIPYLSCRPERKAQWQDRIRGLGKIVVGIAWQGNRKYQADHLRSLPLAHFRPLAEIEGVALVSLQKNDGAEQLTDFAANARLHHFTDELDRDEPFADTAAIIDCLDLVIACDTAIGHLAGAMGKPVWSLQSYSGDWRWPESGDRSPWYPATRLFRQQKLHDWSSVFAEMRGELTQVVQGGRDHLLPPRLPTALSVQTPVSVGELLDKIAILEIKRRRISDPARLKHVEQELAALQPCRPEPACATADVQSWLAELTAVNEQLWDIEDEIRDCERQQNFGVRFIELARSVYKTNDRRAELKRLLNSHYGSTLVEVKSYQAY